MGLDPDCQDMVDHMPDRLEIGQKFYTTKFLGQRFYTLNNAEIATTFANDLPTILPEY